MTRYAPWAVVVTYALLSLAAVLVRSGAGEAPIASRGSANAVVIAARPARVPPPPMNASAAPTPLPVRSPMPSPEPTARVVFLPSLAEQTPLPPIMLHAAAVSAPASMTPSAPSPAASVPIRAEDAAPQIFEVQLPSDVVHPGQTVVGNVVTSSNVASVEVRVARFSTPMLKVGEGHFTLTLTVPHLPFFLRWRTYTVDVIAHNARGDSIEQSLPITVR